MATIRPKMVVNRSDDGRADITGDLDVIEGLHHSDDGAEESEGRSQGDEQADPGEVVLEAGHLDATVAGDGFLNILQTLVDTVETLVEDAGHGATGVAAEFLGGLIVAGFHVVLDTTEEFFDVGGGHVQIEDALNHEGHTENKAEEHGGHPACTTLDVLLFEYLVERLGCLLGGSGGFLSGSNGTCSVASAAG